MALFEPIHRLFWEGLTHDDWREPLRQIYDCELVYVSQGEFRLKIGKTATLIEAGDIAIVPPALFHESWIESGCSAFRHCIHFDWTRKYIGQAAPLMAFADEAFQAVMLHRPPADIAGHLPLISKRAAHAEILPVLEMVLEKLRSEDPLADTLLWPVLNRLLELSSGRIAPAGPGKTGRAVLTIKQLIETRYAEPLGYPDYCRAAQLSRSHLCQAFSSMIGRPPHAYLNDIRLHHARYLLTSTSMNVSEIACAVGIPDANYFARLFRKRFGLSPSRYIGE